MKCVEVKGYPVARIPICASLGEFKGLPRRTFGTSSATGATGRMAILASVLNTELSVLALDGEFTAGLVHASWALHTTPMWIKPAPRSLVNEYGATKRPKPMYHKEIVP